jgi:hypothetical protein
MRSSQDLAASRQAVTGVGYFADCRIGIELFLMAAARTMPVNGDIRHG